LNLGQAVMVYCYQLSQLNQLQQEQETPTDAGQLTALRARVERLLQTLQVADDQKLADWLDQRLGMLAQRDTAMLHTLLHDIEKMLAPKNNA
ncbi:MAG: tRNA/rRNA methyltransferase, partial [Plesiomonas shigelloides]